MGGVSEAVKTLVHSLIQKNIYNEIASVDEPGSLQQQELYIMHELGPAKGSWAYNKALGTWLIENIGRFDAVIVHGLWLYYGYAVRNAFQKNENKNVKLFVMPHGMLDPYFQKAKGRRLKALRNTFYWNLIERRLINIADGLLFTCEEELQLARQTFNGYLPKSEIVIGLGVDRPPTYDQSMKELLNRQCAGIADKKYILFLSRIHEKKGVDLVIKAFVNTYKITDPGKQISAQNEIPRRGTPKEIPTLLIAGPGIDTAYGDYIRSLAHGSGMSEYILFSGMLSGAAKWGAFYHCDAYILPSHQENFGIAIIEALACGKPVLISNQVNIWREIEKEDVGFVSDDNETGVLKMFAYYNKLTQDDKQALKAKAIAAYEQNFSTSRAADNLLNTIAPASSASTRLVAH